MTRKSTAVKMGIKADGRAFFIGAPAALKAMNLPPLQVAQHLEGEFDDIHLFVRTVGEFEAGFLQSSTQLDPKGSLWVSWPKGGQRSTDLTLMEVIELGYRRGLVESKCLSIDALWSALKITHPVEGKTYNNSCVKLEN